MPTGLRKLFHRAAALIGGALLLCAGAAEAQVYKCVDAAGKTVYSQAPCPRNAKSTTLQSTPAPVPAAAAKPDAAAKASGPKTAAEVEQDFKKRKLDEDDAKKKREQEVAEAKLKEENCRNARAGLAGIELGGRQTRINEKGERIFLDDAQIDSEKEKMRRAVQSYCS